MRDINIKIISREEVGKGPWDKFVDSSDGAWLWHRFDLLKGLASWPGRQDLSFALLDEKSGGNILEIIPLQLIRRKVGYLLSFQVLDSLGGPAFLDSLSEKDREITTGYLRAHLVGLAQQYKAMEIRITSSPLAPAFRGSNGFQANPLIKLNCQAYQGQTRVIDLRIDEDLLWRQMEGRARTAIRKAEKSGVKIRAARGAEDLDSYYKLHCATYRRTGVRPHPRDYFEIIWRYFEEDGLALILFAEYENRVVAAANFGIYKKAAIYWTGASIDAGLSLGANSLLQWQAMRQLKKQGLEWFEAGETFAGLRQAKKRRLSDFKKSFGGSLYPYYKGKIATKGGIYQWLLVFRRILNGYKS